MRREGTKEGRGAETKEGGERREPERQRVGETKSEEEFEKRSQIGERHRDIKVGRSEPDSASWID